MHTKKFLYKIIDSFFVSKLAYECAQVKHINIQYTVYSGNYLIEGVANTIITSGIAENN